MQETSLYSKHKKLKAKILPFAGYLMPINYINGIQYEYKSVRNNVGVFDVSHMGKIQIEGENAISLIKKFAINNPSVLRSGDAQYSAICNNNGGIIDDIILYKFSKIKYF